MIEREKVWAVYNSNHVRIATVTARTEAGALAEAKQLTYGMDDISVGYLYEVLNA